MNYELMMGVALELARRGAGSVSPNPMVGAVIVDSCGEIVGCGYHERCGEAHAEVNAINDLITKCPDSYSEILRESTMYVTLEPCSHYGKTPPCADRIISEAIPRVVVGCLDPFVKVSGRGVKKMQDAGIEVVVGVLESECRELNRRFITAQTENRPYIILKWAESADGFMDIERRAEQKPAWFTGEIGKRLVHSWRSIEDAIIVGRNTAVMDNPSLTVREVEGRNPLRLVLDREGVLNEDLNLFDNQAETVVFSEVERERKCAKTVKIDYSKDVIEQILAYLQSEGISSLIVEGGAVLLNSFVERGLWDEARIFTSVHPISYYYNEKSLNNNERGVKAPNLDAMLDIMEAKTECRPHLKERVELNSELSLAIYSARCW